MKKITYLILIISYISYCQTTSITPYNELDSSLFSTTEDGLMLYNNGLYSGEQIGYYESGSVFYRINYLNGLQHGELVYYYDTGSIIMKLNFVNGKLHGEQFYYTEKIKYYENGILIENRKPRKFFDFLE
jgi:hypothetical protein